MGKTNHWILIGGRGGRDEDMGPREGTSRGSSDGGSRKDKATYYLFEQSLS